MTKLRVLVFSKYYTPGYAAGGSMRTIVNLVEHFGDQYAFRVITGDRIRGESQPYPGINVGRWLEVGSAHVMYLAPQQLTFWRIFSLLRNTPHDAVFLNGLFSSLPMLMLRRFGLVPKRQWILAPRGELDPGAIGVKPFKKQVFLIANRVLNLGRGISWQATHDEERGHVAKWFRAKEILIAPDLPTPSPAKQIQKREPKKTGSAHFIFVSRIDAKKNLEFALRCLAGVLGEVTFSIVGPIDDAGVWQRCQSQIAAMPNHVRVEYVGLVEHDEVPARFAQSDAFLLPTKGENFGYVFLESLAAGCPLIISDQTPWRGLSEKGIGWDLPLSDIAVFTSKLQDLVDLDESAHQRLRNAASAYASKYIAESPAFAATRDLLERVCSRP